jgi:hypothetical protein
MFTHNLSKHQHKYLVTSSGVISYDVQFENLIQYIGLPNLSIDPLYINAFIKLKSKIIV